MCYHCATNPSIHHHCHHVMAMLLLLSHHGVAFMSVVVLSLLSCCCGAFAVALSWFHCPHHIVAVLLLPLWCCLHVCHGFVIAIMVSPLCWSRFHHCHHSVAFTLVMVLLLPLWCRLRCRIVAVSLSQLCRCGAFAVILSRFRCCHRSVTFIITLSPCCHCHHGVAFTSVTVSSSPSWCHLHVGRHFIVAVA